ncbi:MAG TPA: amidohydrolase [Candidatus Salinicoccus merdavium]|nr:amidohydrolase [Candidatus Salinicoccus merdavium]
MDFNKIVEDAIQFRRELHRFPELSDEEFNTSKRIQEKLAELDIPFEKGFAGTGVLGIIEGAHEGGIVGLRADIDALPIHETSGVEYSSEVDGVMHACGHDAHTSMLIAAAKVLLSRREEIHGKVLLIFQPAEEKSPTGGSQRMMDEGIFDGREPDVLIAQHVWPSIPAGKFGIMAGPIMGNSDRFKLVIKGSGGHASMPHDTVDAIIVGSQVINALQTIVSRNADPYEPSVVTVGKFQAGTQHNVIAETAEIVGTIRTQSNDVKTLIKERFHSVVGNVVEAMGATVEIEYLDGYPATVNSAEWAEQMRQTAVNLYGEESVPAYRPSLAGEDFGRFLLKYPGVYYWLGTSVGEGQKPLHNPSFKVNEDAFKYGIDVMSQGAIDTLARLKEKQID